MTSEDKEEKRSVELKAHLHGVARAGNQVDECTSDMKNLVIHWNDVSVKPGLLLVAEFLYLLVSIRQHGGEDMMDYFERIISVVEHYERLYGRVNPVVLAEKSLLCLESIKLLVYSDFALSIGKHPNSLEDVMHVLMFHAVKHGRRMTGESKQVETMTLVCRFGSSGFNRRVGAAVKWGKSGRTVLSQRRSRTHWIQIQSRRCGFLLQAGLAKC